MPKGLVLNFHRELDPVLFEQRILAVKKNYRFIGLPELQMLIQQKSRLENICHISFDDGELSFFEIIYPLLKKHNVPVSLFVSPQIIASNSNFWFQEIESFDDIHFRQFIAQYLEVSVSQLEGYTTLSILKCLTIHSILDLIQSYQQANGLSSSPPFNMNISQLLEVEASGLVTVGAHTMNHPILANETNEVSHYEITESIKELEKMLGHPIDYFAYPNGVEQLDYTQREIDYLEQAGIKFSFTTNGDHLINLTSVYQVPRLYYPTMLGLKPAHPLILWRLSLGKKWPKIRRNYVTENDMRIALLKLVTSKREAIKPTI